MDKTHQNKQIEKLFIFCNVCRSLTTIGLKEEKKKHENYNYLLLLVILLSNNHKFIYI